MKNYFRTSTTNSTALNLFKTFSYSVIFWLLFLFILPLMISFFEAKLWEVVRPYEILGGVLFLLFSLLNIWSAIIMSKLGKGTPLPIDCPNKLVIRGPYRFVRNPMAIGGIGQGISVGMYLGSVFTILYALIGAIIWHLLVRPFEEKDLEKRFGDEFLDYKSRIRTWIPSFY